MARTLLSLIVGLCLQPCVARAADWNEPSLWQESYFMDALLAARDRQSRSESDPQMIPVLKSIAGQVAQQVANLQQIDDYAKAQADNLRYAFGQADPAPSLETIGANFDTLTHGDDQIRNNLYYLTVRCRIAASQALPDPDMYQASISILTQVQQLQLELNNLYTDVTADRQLVLDNSWATDKDFREKTELLLRSVVFMQDAVFAIYNAGYDLSTRCK